MTQLIMLIFSTGRLAVKEITVRLGEYDLGEKSAVERDFQVARMFMHEAFERRAYTNDIALLTLKTKVVFGSHIRPICLPLSHIDLENRTTSVTGIKMELSSVLRVFNRNSLKK